VITDWLALSRLQTAWPLVSAQAADSSSPPTPHSPLTVIERHFIGGTPVHKGDTSPLFDTFHSCSIFYTAA
jgi:hypothetical protein